MASARRSLLGAALPAFAVLAAALWLRLPELDKRPMHGDEANQAVRTGLLLERGVYRYDPNDHHGPVLYYAALPFCRVTSRLFAETTEWNYRLVPVAFGCLTLLLMLGLGASGRDGLFRNREGLGAAVLLTAVSPAMVYYSRFFIQETLFVTFLTGMLVCAVGYVRAHGSALYAAGFGAFAGLALATKETVVLSFAAAALAALAACGFRRLLRAWNTRHALLAAGAALAVAALFYSSFFTYWQGLHDALFATISTYFKRATAVPEHQHPWNFYLKLLFWFKYGRSPVWSEAWLLLPAALALVAAFRPARVGTADAEGGARARWVRFVAVYTVLLTALYSAIPYKTPWCVLTFLHGYILLAGVGFGELAEGLRKVSAKRPELGRAVALALLLALVLREVGQAKRACFTWPADPRNPFVYAHTGTDALNLVAAVEAAAAAAQGVDTAIAVAVPTPDTWPLPWYLRRYRQVGYWTRVEQVPEAFAPVVVIAAADQGDAADARFGAGKRASFYGIRPGTLLNLFVPERSASHAP